MDRRCCVLFAICVFLVGNLANDICPIINIENGEAVLNSGVVASVLCYIGFQLVGRFELSCQASGEWDFEIPKCVRDCGVPRLESNVKWQTTGTLVGDSLTFFCSDGLALSSNLTITCQADGTWLGVVPFCVTDCGQPALPENGNVSTAEHTTFGAKALYTCASGYRIEGDHVIRECQENGTWSGTAPACRPYEASTILCPPDQDVRGRMWEEYPAGQTAFKLCPEEFIGNISRQCGTQGDWQRPRYNCVRGSIRDIQATISALPDQPTEQELLAVTEELLDVANLSTTSDPATTVTDAEILILSAALETVTSLVPDTPIDIDSLTHNVLGTASVLTDQANKESWLTVEEEENVGADQIMGAVESMAMKEATQSTVNVKIFVKTNIALEIRKTQGDIVAFPSNLGNSGGWVQAAKSKISAKSMDLAGQEITTFGIIYKNMTDILAAKESSNQSQTKKIVNGPVISLTVVSPPDTFTPTVTYVIEHSVEGYAEPSCTYWLIKSNSRGHWSPAGCEVVFTNDSITKCECDHLTNFAVLMSPFVSADSDSSILKIISIVGISVSLFCLVVTFVVHLCLLKYLRSDRVTLLMNLCVALILAYAVFLGGIDRTESKVVCTCMAALLHYIFLVVFFIMLAEGIDVAFSVLFVFTKKKRIKFLLSSAWVLPSVIVGVSLGITETDGYGNGDFCWLSIDDGLIWAFVGPAAAVIILNVLIIIIAVYKIFQVQSVKQKSATGQIKTSIWSLCVLVPLMGISWVLGIFYISEDLFWIQYIFAVCNGLQGLFIFVIHCVFNIQIRRAFKRAKEKRKRSSAMKTTIKNTSRITSNSRKYVDKSSSPAEVSAESSAESSKSQGYSEE